jgi:acyl-CoA synthetase (AMP-forming)/AMP-acid ligase II
LERGSRSALVDATTGRAITYQQLPDLVARAAAALAALGVRKGDVCAIFSGNTTDYPIAVLAIARLGAIVTTINTLATPEDLDRQLRDSGATILIVSPKGLTHSVSTRVISFDDLAKGTDTPPAVAIDPEDLIALPYSSGTTGLPKGVMLTHRNLVANLLQVDSSSHLRDGEDTLIAFLPFFHIYGLEVIMLLGLWSGATIVVMPKFDLEQYLDLVERHRASVLHVVPPIVLAIAKSAAAADRDFSSVRKLFSGAAPLGADVTQACCARVGCVLQQGYGMTEASPATHTTSDIADEIKPGSIGTLVANTECRVVDPATHQDVAPGQDGEIWVRGPQVMRGYFNRPEETRATVDADGWLHTGDIGHADADGHFFIVDRLKELIKYKGLQVAPAELESVLLSHPAVKDAAVVPQKDETGELPHAFVVLKALATAEDLMAFVAARVAPYKKVRRITFVDVIPKSPSGKILRRVLRESLEAHPVPQAFRPAPARRQP